MFYDDSLIVCRGPKWIRQRVQDNMEYYNMDLYDSFDEAVRSYPRLHESKKLYNAFYHSDYRQYIPSAYYPA